VSNNDLPEPQQTVFTDEEKKLRHWQLMSTIVTFIAAYATLHKLLIPLFLKFTSVTKTPYAEIDILFLHPLCLAFLLQKKKNNTKLISSLCGFAVAYGVYELIQVTQGNYEGWLAVSRLLSALPLAVSAGYIMSQASPGRSFPMAWLGAVGVAVLLFLNSTPSQIQPKAPVEEVAQDEDPIRQLNPVNQECGNAQLVINRNETYPTTNEIIIDEPCGLRPAVISPSLESLKVVNQTNRPINIHLMVFSSDKLSSRWNIMAIARTTVETPKLSFSPDEFGVIFSDNTPEVGLTALVFNSEKTIGRFQISRSPLKVRPLP